MLTEVEENMYLLELSRYVHLNPVRLASYKGREAREKIKDLERYPWSSLAGYLSSSQKQFWATYDTGLRYLGGSRRKYREFVIEGIRQGYETPCPSTDPDVQYYCIRLLPWVRTPNRSQG